MCDSHLLTAGDLGLVVTEQSQQPHAFESYFDLPLTEARDRLVEDFERAAIEKAIKDSVGNVSAAARQLGIHRQSLQQKMAKLGMRI